MITTQRLIMIVILMNLVIGWAGEIMINPYVYSDDQYDAQIAKYEEMEQQLGSEDNIYGGQQNTNLLTESAVGNIFRWGWTFIKIFTNAINPFSIHPGQFDDPMEDIFAWILMFIRSMLIILMGFEGYLTYHNKKAS